ncbi:MAG: FAD-binding oxidoreductase [Candidatus Thorarchaeota archaeon]
MDGDVLQKLSDIVGEAYISAERDLLLTYSASTSTGRETKVPGAVVRPANTQQVSEILKVANEHFIKVSPHSGGPDLYGEAITAEGGLVIDLLRLDSIVLHPDLRAVTVGAGMNFVKLDEYLNKHDLWVPVTPTSPPGASLGRSVAENGSGFGSSRFGCIAEMIQGLEVVLPDGTIIQTGTEANPNAPGPFLRYAFGPDITGLFIGSSGAFGIITKVSLKTYKRMHFFDFNTYGFDTLEEAREFTLELKENEVSTVWTRLYERQMLEFSLDTVGEEYGVPRFDWPPVTVSLVIGGVREDQMQNDAEAAREICEQTGGRVLEVRELPAGEWNNRMRDLRHSSDVRSWHGRVLHHHQAISNLHKTLEEMRRAMDESGVLCHAAGFQSGHSSYNYDAQLFFDPEDEGEEERVNSAHSELVRKLFKTGAVPFRMAPHWTEGVSEMDSYFSFVKRLKERIDPNGIMNPGVPLRQEGDA